jgi:hypothetical protein
MNLAYIGLSSLSMVVWSMMSRFVTAFIPGMSRAQGVFSLITSHLVALFVIMTATSMPTLASQRKQMLYALTGAALAGLCVFSMIAFMNGTGNMSFSLVEGFEMDIPVLVSAFVLPLAYYFLQRQSSTDYNGNRNRNRNRNRANLNRPPNAD